ncbi:MAG: VWA domain-containing protein [Candidatus Altiarchaeota archaeon]
MITEQLLSGNVVKIEFSTTHYDMIAFMVIASIIIYYLANRYFRARVLRFGNFETLEKVAGRQILPPGLLPLLIRLLVIVSFVFAASDPRIVEYRQVMGEDFVLVIDTSSSMLTPDLEPNRLEATKETAIRWISALEDVRIGVVTFAGRPYIRMRPTVNKDDVIETIKAISPDSPAGTAIGDALISSSALLSESDRNKTIMLITDGRNNVGVSINDSINSLLKNNVRVYTVGIGTTESLNIVVPPELEEKNATIASFPGLDEEVLNYLANKTGGTYSRVEDMQSLKGVFLTKVTQTETISEPVPYILFIAAALLLLEWAIDITKYRPIP